MSGIIHATIWKFHVNTDIDYILKRNNYKSVPVWLVQSNDVAHWYTKHCVSMIEVTMFWLAFDIGNTQGFPFQFE